MIGVRCCAYLVSRLGPRPRLVCTQPPAVPQSAEELFPVFSKDPGLAVFTPAQESAARWLFEDRNTTLWAQCATPAELSALEARAHPLPEVAFFGKSNTGARPGLTQAVHVLELRECLRLVDLPGYGHAAASPADLARLTVLLKAYLGLPSVNRSRRNLKYADLPDAAKAKMLGKERARLRESSRRREELIMLCVLVDARRGVGEEEEALLSDLDILGTPYMLTLTKCDKLSDMELGEAKAAAEAALLKHPRSYSEVVCTSSLTGEGVARLRTLLAQAVRPMLPVQRLGRARDF